MINLLNKSVKSIYQNFSAQEPRPSINYIKLIDLSIHDTYTSQSLIVIINTTVNVYILQTDPIIEFKLIFSQSFNLKISSVHPINYIARFASEKPLIGLVVNSNADNESAVKIFSIQCNSFVHSVGTKYMIIEASFKKKYYALGCVNGKIYVYDNMTTNMIMKINMYNIKLVNKNCEDNIDTIEEKVNKPMMSMMSMMIDNRNNDISSFIDVPTAKSMMVKKEANKGTSYKKIRKLYAFDVKFDLSDSHIAYYITKKKLNAIPEENENQDTTSLSPFETFAVDCYKNLSKLKDWSIKNISEFNALYKSKSTTSSNSSLSSSLKVNIFNMSTGINEDIINDNTIEKINVPFFKDGIGVISMIKNGKFILVGNRHNQMFYLYELYPQTNTKYSSNIVTYKIIYSFFRGMRACSLSSIDIDDDLAVITSSRGTHHIFSMPRRDNQIIEDIEDIPNSSDVLNSKVVNAIEIEKVNNNMNGGVFSNRILNIDRVNVESNFDKENRKLIYEKSTSSPYINNGNYVFMINDNIVDVSLVSKTGVASLKRSKLVLAEENEVISANYTTIKKTAMMACSINSNKKKNDVNILSMLSLDEETTETSNFSTIMLNPLFKYKTPLLKSTRVSSSILSIELQISFVIAKNKMIVIKSQYDSNEETISLFTSLCEERDYSDLTIASRKRSENEAFASMRLKSDDKNDNLANNIKNAMSTNIKDVIKTTNSVDMKGKIVFQDDYYK